MAGSATYKRVMVEVDDVKFYPVEARYALKRDSNHVGRRVGNSVAAKAYIWADAHDVHAISQDDTIALWKFATETSDPLHKVSITYYAEDGSRVLSNVEFKGWISVFEYFNPALNGNGAISGAAMGGGQAAHSMTGYNNLLYMELSVVLDESAVSAHKFTK